MNLFFKTLTALATTLLISSNSLAKEAPSPFIKLSDNFYLITQFGTKVGVSVGDDGLLIIDTPIKKHADELLTIIREISNKPIKLLINTHSDFDHTGGNERLAQHGATILSQENVAYSKAKHEILLGDNSTIIFNEDRVNLVSVLSHSYSDLLIHFEKENLIFMGDVLGNKSHPTFYSGGIKGLNNAFDKALSMANKSTKFISGHGYIYNSTQLRAHQKAVNDWVLAIKKYKDQGIDTNSILEKADIKLLIQAFNGKDKDNHIKSNRLVKLVERTISTELIHSDKINIDYEEYTGRYIDESKEVIDIISRKNKLFLVQKHRRIIELLPINKTDFHARAALHNNYDSTFSVSNNIRLLSIGPKGDKTIFKKQ